MIKKCKWCGKEYETEDWRRKYCSKECYKESVLKQMRLRHKRCYKPVEPRYQICPVCGKEFWVSGPDLNKRKYCSSECTKKASKRDQAAYRKRLKHQKKIDACKAKHGDCYDCDMPVGMCRYD